MCLPQNRHAWRGFIDLYHTTGILSPRRTKSFVFAHLARTGWEVSRAKSFVSALRDKDLLSRSRRQIDQMWQYLYPWPPLMTIWKKFIITSSREYTKWVSASLADRLCPRYAAQCNLLLTSAARILGEMWSSSSDARKINFFLFGVKSVNYDINCTLFR